MDKNRVYRNDSRVEVLQASGEWARAMVFGFESRDGVWKYYVQRSGFPACTATDPTCWYTIDEIRAS